jgi:23S rRNA (cytidine1920-2'-O)/16S rRNA (cytidine1409-2'-O)-methyltransferase
MVRAGRVSVDGRPATKPAVRVAVTATIEVEAGADPDWVGRGARKLDGLLDDLADPGYAAHPADLADPGYAAADLASSSGGAAEPGPGTAASTTTGPSPARGNQGPLVRGRRCLDAGASTGGFTQVLLDRGAREVVAVDVGHDQLAEVLRTDARVHDHPGTSVRGLDPADVGGPAELLVADLSFISLQVVLPDLMRLVSAGGDLLLLVKPQFEVGRRRLGSGGVVRDPRLRIEAVHAVATAAVDLGLTVRAVRASRWPGPSGNVEYFVWLTLPWAASEVDDTVDPLASGAAVSREALATVVRAAVEEGPS